MRRLKSILLIDDDDLTNNFHNRLIGKLNVTESIKITQNGKEAIDYLLEADRYPDLILLDLNMPVMNGFEFIEAFGQAFNTNHNMVVIMLTTTLISKEIEHANHCENINELVSKPLTKDKLEYIMNKYFSES